MKPNSAFYKRLMRARKIRERAHQLAWDEEHVRQEGGKLSKGMRRARENKARRTKRLGEDEQDECDL